MRFIFLAAALVVLAPATYAQTATGNAGGMSSGPNRATTPPPGRMAAQQGGENCGTPDEPKPCPPLPRHPLASYPPNKQ
jgi:hypothetical protein